MNIHNNNGTSNMRTISLCSHIFLVLRDHGVYMYVLFTFENGVLLMRKGASVVWHHSLLLMNSFNKTKAAVFSCRLCFLRAFPFISLMQQSPPFSSLRPTSQHATKLTFFLTPTHRASCMVIMLRCDSFSRSL